MSGRWSFIISLPASKISETHNTSPGCSNKTMLKEILGMQLFSLTSLTYWEQRYTVVRENIPIFLEKVTVLIQVYLQYLCLDIRDGVL